MTEIMAREVMRQSPEVVIFDQTNMPDQPVVEGIIACCNDSWGVDIPTVDGGVEKKVKYAHPTLRNKEAWQIGGDMHESIAAGNTIVGVVMDNGKVVATAMLVKDETLGRYELGRYFSDRTAKKNGHATAITNRLFQIAQEKGITEIYFDRAWNRTSVLGAIRNAARHGYATLTMDFTPAGTYGDDEASWGCIGLVFAANREEPLTLPLPMGVPHIVSTFLESLTDQDVNHEKQIILVDSIESRLPEQLAPTEEGPHGQMIVDIYNIQLLQALEAQGYIATSCLPAGKYRTYMIRMIPPELAFIPQYCSQRHDSIDPGASPVYTTRPEELVFLAHLQTVLIDRLPQIEPVARRFSAIN